jgi:hypothetical protein
MMSLIETCKPRLQQQQQPEQGSAVDKSTPEQPTYKYQMKRRMVRIMILTIKFNSKNEFRKFVPTYLSF